jgi:hypothetical protein
MYEPIAPTVLDYRSGAFLASDLSKSGELEKAYRRALPFSTGDPHSISE